MEIYDDKICVTAEEVEKVLPLDTLMSLCRRNQAQRVRRGCRETPALYCVDGFKHSVRVKLHNAFPELSDEKARRAAAEQQNIVVKQVVPDPSARAFFDEYRKPGGAFLSADEKQKYYNSAIVLNAMRRVWDEMYSLRAKSGHRMMPKREFWRIMGDNMPSVCEQYVNCLPWNARRLQQASERYHGRGATPCAPAGGGKNYGCLLKEGMFGNGNRKKVKDEQQRALLFKLCNDRRNLDNEQVAMLYNAVADELGWASITGGTAANYRAKYALETAAGRHGVTHLRNTKEMQHRRSVPSAPMLLWSADGWDVELYYRQTSEDSAGRRVTTYNNRLTVIVVMDPYNNYPVGYATGDHETPGLIHAALRNAVNHTQQLFGQRYRAYQYQSDHYALKKMLPSYREIAKHVTPARVKNAKSKPVERYFGQINKKYCQLYGNWSGFGVTSDKSLQPNADAINARRHSFPDYAGCVEQVRFIIEKERSEKRAAYLEGWRRVPEERRLPLSKEAYLFTFGEIRYKKGGDAPETNTLEASGLNPTIGGVKRSYDCFDLEFRRQAHHRWVVRYDPDDLSEVLAVSEDGTRRFMLEERYVQPMALADRKEGDGARLSRVDAFNRQLEEHVIRTACEADATVEELFTSTPALRQYNELQKLVMPDSDGQHKNRRNAARSSLGGVNLKELEIKTVTAGTVDMEDVPLGDLY